MAVDLCFYFQVHQPWRLRNYRFLEVGKNHQYFDQEKNASILRKVANQCYLPMNDLLYELILANSGRFKFAFSITVTALQQMEAYAPEVVGSFKRLFETGCVELLSETSHHSLAGLYSETEFEEQLKYHRREMIRLLTEPSPVFRNTELISSNAIAKKVSSLGYQGILMEGADHILRWRSPLFKYSVQGAPGLVGLMKNYKLSDDIAFRFSDRGWSQWPLTAEKFEQWIRLIDLENPVAARGGVPMVGLFMDYETFGEHQWASTGIFKFMNALPERFLSIEGLRFVTPFEAVQEAKKMVRPAEGLSPPESSPNLDQIEMFKIDAPEPFSWADVERDLSAWQGNPIQDAALRTVFRLEKSIKSKVARMDSDAGQELLETWRRLLTSDHFYYMCTKYFADGDVHKYFNPYDSPYDAHILYMNVMADLALCCDFRELGIA
jgi:alpha-amylase